MTSYCSNDCNVVWACSLSVMLLNGRQYCSLALYLTARKRETADVDYLLTGTIMEASAVMAAHVHFECPLLYAMDVAFRNKPGMKILFCS